jgi:HD-GYP domain-containing protein (c-di-GMP phosphodiesterase class II)
VALNELRRCAGSQFDPAIVSAFSEDPEIAAVPVAVAVAS